MTIFLVTMLVIYLILSLVSLIVVPTQHGKPRGIYTSGYITANTVINLISILVTVLLIINLTHGG